MKLNTQETTEVIGHSVFYTKDIRTVELLLPPRQFERLKDKRAKNLQILLKHKYWIEVIKLMKSTDFEAIVSNKLNPSNQVKLMKSLEGCQFKNLKFINIKNSHARNVEAFSFIDMPYIQSLIIFWNEIINANGLAKTNWPMLKRLSLQHNYIVDFGQFYRMRLFKEQFDFLQVQRQKGTIFQDKSILAKVQLLQLQRIIQHTNEIPQQTVIMTLFQKYPNAQLVNYPFDDESFGEDEI